MRYSQLESSENMCRILRVLIGMGFWGISVNFDFVFTIITELYMFDEPIDVPMRNYYEIDVFLY